MFASFIASSANCSAYLALVFIAACSTSAEVRTTSSSAAEESYAQAVDALHSGDFELAEQRAKVALQGDPLHVRSHLLLANLLARPKKSQGGTPIVAAWRRAG